MIAERIELGLSGRSGFVGSEGKERGKKLSRELESWFKSGVRVSSISVGGLTGVGSCVGGFSFDRGAFEGSLRVRLGVSFSGELLSELIVGVSGGICSGSYLVRGESPLVGAGVFTITGVVGDKESLSADLRRALRGGAY